MESQDKDLNTELNSDLETESPPDVAPVEPQAEEPGYAVPPSPKKSKAPLIIAIVAAAALLCIVCVVGVVLASQYLPFLAPERAAARLMPADTAFFTSINVDIEDALLGYKHLDEVYGDIPEFEGALDDFLDQLEDELDISYKDDVKPWLGPEVAIAIGNMKDLFEGEEPVIIIAAATRDTRASDAFLEKMVESLEDQDYDVGEETYQDVAYYVAEPENDWETPMVFGTVKKHLILTTYERIMEKVIDVAKGDSDSLADKERYTKLVGALPDDAVACMFFDMEDLAKAGLQGLESEGFDLPRESSEQLEAFQAFGLALSLDTEGIQFDVAMAFDPDALPPEALESFGAKASPNRILKRIPDDALGFLSGQDLAAFWKSAFASLMDIPDAEEQLDDLEDATGLKLDEELLDWLSGEFAIALVKAEGIEDVPIGGFAVFEIDDQEKAKDSLEDIVGALEEMAGFELEDKDIGDVEMQVLQDPYGEEIILGYGFTDEHLVIGFSEDALEEATNDDIRSITADETFKKVQKHLPGKTGGCVYVNVEAVWRLAYRSMSDYDKENFNEEIRPFLEPIVAIGMGAPPTDPEKGISQGTLFIYIPGE